MKHIEATHTGDDRIALQEIGTSVAFPDNSNWEINHKSIDEMERPNGSTYYLTQVGFIRLLKRGGYGKSTLWLKFRSEQPQSGFFSIH